MTPPTPWATLRLVPLDGRPVCLAFVKQLANLAGIGLLTPPAHALTPLGDVSQLKTPSPWPPLAQWLANTQTQAQATLLSCDRVAHGGLIPARLHSAPLETTLAHCQQVLESLINSNEPHPIYGFSSICRIPNYNNAEEEPDDWATYGTALYTYSRLAHQLGHTQAREQVPPAQLPEAVLQAMLERRQRLHALNEWWLSQALPPYNKLASAVFCQDDTGPYGLNVQEAQALATACQLHPHTWVQTGADEVAHTLLARWAVEQALTQGKLATKPTVWVAYTHPHVPLQLARFDGVSVAEVVAQRLASVGLSLASSPQQADLLWLVHGAVGDPQHLNMGDHCQLAPAITHESQHASLRHWVDEARLWGKPLLLGDVAYANGGDPTWVADLLAQPKAAHVVTAYAGWNTPGNALGCCLAMGTLHWLASQLGTLNPEAHRVALAHRLLEDVAYQAVLRQQFRPQAPYPTSALATALTQAMQPDAQAVLRWVGLPPATQVEVTLPCGRWFEADLSFSVS